MAVTQEYCPNEGPVQGLCFMPPPPQAPSVSRCDPLPNQQATPQSPGPGSVEEKAVFPCLQHPRLKKQASLRIVGEAGPQKPTA